MKLFRILVPSRTYSKKHTNYNTYKIHLAQDFNNRCGYTDCSDSWFGGKNNFHIDHFIPWKKHKDKSDLKTNYSNLVYCCSYVNIAKSDDEGLYLDPCNDNYNEHFQRNDDGTIIPLTKHAQYMHDKMKLYLERYRIIWILDQLENRLDKLQKIVVSGNEEARELHYSLLCQFYEYWKYLKKSQ